MALFRGCSKKLVSSLLFLAVAVLLGMDRFSAEDHTLDQKIELIWGAAHTYFFMDGDTETLALSLDENLGSCFRSLDMYLFARIDVDIKLVEGNSAGTVATVYVRSLICSSFSAAVSLFDGHRALALFFQWVARSEYTDQLHASVRLV